MSHLFPSQDMKQNTILSSYADVLNFNFFLGSTSEAMPDREKKRGRRKYEKLNISRTKRAF